MSSSSQNYSVTNDPVVTMTDADRALLQAMLDQFRRINNNATGRSYSDRYGEEDTSPDIYLAQVPLDGIPGRIGTRPGIAKCTIFNVIFGDPIGVGTGTVNESPEITSAFDDQEVYNVFSYPILGCPSTRYVLVHREKFGTWVVSDNWIGIWAEVTGTDCEGNYYFNQVEPSGSSFVSLTGACSSIILPPSTFAREINDNIYVPIGSIQWMQPGPAPNRTPPNVVVIGDDTITTYGIFHWWFKDDSCVWNGCDPLDHEANYSRNVVESVHFNTDACGIISSYTITSYVVQWPPCWNIGDITTQTTNTVSDRRGNFSSEVSSIPNQGTPLQNMPESYNPPSNSIKKERRLKPPLTVTVTTDNLENINNSKVRSLLGSYKLYYDRDTTDINQWVSDKIVSKRRGLEWKLVEDNTATPTTVTIHLELSLELGIPNTSYHDNPVTASINPILLSGSLTIEGNKIDYMITM
jgi:hypothetical protein